MSEPKNIMLGNNIADLFFSKSNSDKESKQL